MGQGSEQIITPSKFGAKVVNLHETITITKPGVYDYKGTMHIWKGDGGCHIFSDPLPSLTIDADNVTVKNFGVRSAKTGIYVTDKEDGRPRSGVKIENIEVRACYKALALPLSFNSFLIKDSIFEVR